MLHGARCVTTYTHVRLFLLFSELSNTEYQQSSYCNAGSNFSVGNWFNQFTEILKHKMRFFSNCLIMKKYYRMNSLQRRGKIHSSDFCPLAVHL